MRRPSDLLPENSRGGNILRLAEFLVLGVVAAWMTGHALLCHGVLVRLLLLLEIALVVQGRLGGHVGRRHGVVVGGHAAGLAGLHLRVVVLGRVDGVVVDAICIPT